MSTLLLVDWKTLLMGGEEWSFLFEIVLRTAVMFIIVLTGLTVVGKRGVKQLSVFELVVIIGLGSAAGDPMFYKDVGLLPAVIVFAIVIGLYVFVTNLVGKSKKVEHLLEGKPVCLVQQGSFAIRNFEKEHLAQDEFFAELRLHGVAQLGQVEQAIIETSGQVSVYFYEDKNVKYGLPILPGVFETQQKAIDEPGWYACSFCGFTKEIKSATTCKCSVCNKDLWIRASNRVRVK